MSSVSLCVLHFAVKDFRLSDLYLNLGVRRVPDGYREGKGISPPPVSYSRLGFTLRSPSQTWFVNQVPKSELLKDLTELKPSLEGRRMHRGWEWVPGLPSSLCGV